MQDRGALLCKIEEDYYARLGELLSKINVINSKYCEVKALSSPHSLNTQGQPSHFNESFTIIRFMRSTKHLPW